LLLIDDENFLFGVERAFDISKFDCVFKWWCPNWNMPDSNRRLCIHLQVFWFSSAVVGSMS